jgi:hypothetical protein
MLVQFLQDNRDVFAWQPTDMPGVPRELAEHKLKVYPQARPIRQKLRRFTPDKREAIRAELARLVAAGFVTEVLCDGTSQVIRPTYSCPCPTDLRQPCRCP